jgi:organic radical activating enzyme
VVPQPARSSTRAVHAPLSVADILARLAQRRGKLDGVVVTGGEPTLQLGLASFLHTVKRLGFATKLDTNGSNPASCARCSTPASSTLSRWT